MSEKPVRRFSQKPGTRLRVDAKVARPTTAEEDREQRVAQIKEAIQNGTYEIENRLEEAAERMLQELDWDDDRFPKGPSE